jgi:hypothetical protein
MALFLSSIVQAEEKDNSFLITDFIPKNPQPFVKQQLVLILINLAIHN